MPVFSSPSLLRSTLHFVLTAAMLSHVFPNTNLSPHPSTGARNRQLSVQKVAVEHSSDLKGQPAMKVTATVKALQLQGRPIRVQVRLRDLRGHWIQAQPDTSPGSQGQAGFVAAADDTIRLNDASWIPQVFIPYAAVADSLKQSDLLTISVEAYCDGLSALSEIETSVGPALPRRLPISVCVLEVQTSTEAPDPHIYPMSKDPLASHPGRPPRPGARVYGNIVVGGLAGQEFAAYLSLRRMDGSWVRAIPAALSSFAAADGRFAAPILPPAILENTYFSGLMGAIPYDVLDLPPGDHRLVLSYVVQVGLLRGRAETDVLFSLLPRH